MFLGGCAGLLLTSVANEQVDIIYVTIFGQPDEFVKDYELDHPLMTSMDQITHGMWLGRSNSSLFRCKY